MLSNIKRVITLSLLVLAASPALAASTSVSDVNSSSRSETDIQRVQRLLDNSNRVQARLQQQVDAQNAEITTLRGTIERSNYDMKQLVERQRQLFIELDNLRTDVKKAKVAPTTASAVTSTVAAIPASTFDASKDEQSSYQTAVDMILKDRNYDGAITAFQQFKTQYPNSSLSGNANYWLGQLYFAKKKDGDAARSFAAVISEAKSPKRPDALVKLGDIAKRNNKADIAKKYYQQVIKEYPDSSAAKLAQGSLQ
ncbi:MULTISPECIES: tol-pal system protein YbgF [Vibrio]|uniref:Cell division coordinator CpoB n=1 Tax=Vibrio algicola TaxID=2662262 RepID=A0A5Q0TE53_9VIBR|nr:MULTISPECIES: tol-pal system protein YbgF [Vibrio]MBD1575391.1 tol-pal system protein YbgF [Vibrio sp. S11_S32]